MAMPPETRTDTKRTIHFLHIGKNTGTQIMAVFEHVMQLRSNLEVVKHSLKSRSAFAIEVSLICPGTFCAFAARLESR